MLCLVGHNIVLLLNFKVYLHQIEFHFNFFFWVCNLVSWVSPYVTGTQRAQTNPDSHQEPPLKGAKGQTAFHSSNSRPLIKWWSETTTISTTLGWFYFDLYQVYDLIYFIFLSNLSSYSMFSIFILAMSIGFLWALSFLIPILILLLFFEHKF